MNMYSSLHESIEGVLNDLCPSSIRRNKSATVTQSYRTDHLVVVLKQRDKGFAAGFRHRHRHWLSIAAMLL